MRDWLKILAPVLAAVLGALGGGTLGYNERDDDFQRVVAKYKATKHDLAECIASETVTLR